MMFKDQLLNASEFMGSHPRVAGQPIVGSSQNLHSPSGVRTWDVRWLLSLI